MRVVEIANWHGLTDIHSALPNEYFFELNKLCAVTQISNQIQNIFWRVKSNFVRAFGRKVDTFFAVSWYWISCFKRYENHVCLIIYLYYPYFYRYYPVILKIFSIHVLPIITIAIANALSIPMYQICLREILVQHTWKQKKCSLKNDRFLNIKLISRIYSEI